MTRRAPRTDGNQTDVVDALRAAGFSVQSLAGLADGVPDLLVGSHEVNVLLEVKRPPGPKGGMKGRNLTPDQVRWHEAWKGQCATVYTPEQAVAAVRTIIQDEVLLRAAD